MKTPPVARVRGVKPTDAVRTIVFADSPYAVQAIDDVLMVDATAGVVVVKIPSVATLRKAYLNRRLTVKKIDASANGVTVTAFAGDLIDGAATVALTAQYDSTTITNDLGDNLWWAVAIGTGATPPSGGITDLTGDVTATGPGSAVATIPNDTVTYAKMQNVSAASRLLGRGSAAGAGDVQELTISTGLSLSGTALSATATGTVTTTGSPISGDMAKFSGATSITNATAGTDYTALAFKTIAVATQSDIVADTPADTLTVVAGTGIAITTNAGTDTLTIAASGSSGIDQLTGDVTAGPGSGSQPATLSATGVAAATYGDSTHVGQFTVDAKGRLTFAGDVLITAGGIGAADVEFAFFMG